MRLVVLAVTCFRAERGQGTDATDPAAEARDVLGRHLAHWGLEGVAEDVLLVATELLSNALRYGTPPRVVRMRVVLDDSGRRCVRLEVADGGAGIDVDRVRAHWRHPSSPLMTGGRGLFIVDTLAARWGDDRSGPGHTVWVELEAGAESAP